MRSHSFASLFLLASVPLLFSVASCSSDEFEGQSNTGGTAGDSGVGGSAGSGTGGLPASCTDNSECSDGKSCNGTETCEGGKCVAGTDAPCPNPDPAHCTTSCEESGSGFACSVTGLDSDGDSHGDAQCTQALSGADDCDDGNADVSPEATEACNGIDDDCDGKDDLSDGFQLFGAAAELVKGTGGSYQPAIVWGADSYGMVWVDHRDANKARIYFALVAADGTLKSTPIGLSDPAIPAPSLQPDIAWNGSEFAVVWNGFRFLRVTADGTPQPPIETSSDPGIWPSIHWTGAAWQVGYLRTSVRARSVSASGQMGEEKIVSSGSADSEEMTSAFIGSTVGYSWDVPPPNKTGVVYFARTDTSLTVLGEGAITADPQPTMNMTGQARIGAVGDGFGIAYRHTIVTSEAVEYVERKLDGSPGCGPLILDDQDNLSHGWPQRVGQFGNRTGILLLDGIGTGSTVKLARVGDNCTFVDAQTIAVGTLDDPERNATFAKGPEGHILVWVQGTGTSRAIHSRVLGPNLCDAPG